MSATEHAYQRPKLPMRTIVIALGVLALIAAGVFFFSRDKAWARPDIPTASQSVGSRESLADISAGADQPTFIVAMVNASALAYQYPVNCDADRQARWPHPYFCNDRLNLAEAHTLRPDQELRIMATNAMPQSITAVSGATRSMRRVAILVDTSSQANVDHAAAIAYTLRQQGKEAVVWAYTRNTLFQFVDRGRSFALDTERPAAQSAIGILSSTNTQGIVLVTGAALDFEGGIPGAKPVIGYCMVSTCERDMRELVGTTRGTYIPYA